MIYLVQETAIISHYYMPSPLFLLFFSLFFFMPRSFAPLKKNQVSDIFQFYTQRNMNELSAENVELVASSTSRNSSAAASIHPLLICSLAIFVSFCYTLLTTAQHRKLKTEVI